MHPCPHCTCPEIKIGQTYWTLNFSEEITVDEYDWSDDCFDQERLKVNLVFLTQEKAQEAANKIKAILKEMK